MVDRRAWLGRGVSELGESTGVRVTELPGLCVLKCVCSCVCVCVCVHACVHVWVWGHYIKLKSEYRWSLCFVGEGSGNSLQYSCLENPTDGGAWWAAVHGVSKSWTQLSDFTFTFHFHALQKEMATHSSVLAWRIPGTGEPGGLPSIGSHRVGHN